LADLDHQPLSPSMNVLSLGLFVFFPFRTRASRLLAVVIGRFFSLKPFLCRTMYVRWSGLLGDEGPKSLLCERDVFLKNLPPPPRKIFPLPFFDKGLKREEIYEMSACRCFFSPLLVFFAARQPPNSAKPPPLDHVIADCGSRYFLPRSSSPIYDHFLPPPRFYMVDHLSSSCAHLRRPSSGFARFFSGVAVCYRS